MPTKKLSEYQCKKLWDLYTGRTSHVCDYLSREKLTLSNHLQNNLVVKLDDGSKRRMKRGLVQLNKTRIEVLEWVREKLSVAEFAHSKFYVEQMNTNVSNDTDDTDSATEMYMMIRSNDEYDSVYINELGGIHQQNPLDGAHEIKCFINEQPSVETIRVSQTTKQLDYWSNLQVFIVQLLLFYRHFHLTFLEVNPLLRRENTFTPLDFACLMDDCGMYLLEPHYKKILQLDYFNQTTSNIESYIASLDAKTGGSLKFSLLNPTGSIWTMVAGGGASVVYTDAICNYGYSCELANYGEYSGNPPEELVFEYANAIFNEMKQIPREKTLFIGGGIANFTDIKKTFIGITRAMEANIELFDSTTVYIRRGGPKYKEGLALFEDLKERYGLRMHIYGPEEDITSIVTMALGQNKPHMDLPSNDYDSLVTPSVEELNMESNATYEFTKDDAFFMYSYQPTALQRMMDFDYVCGKGSPSIVAVIDPRKSKDAMDAFLWGGETILVPIYNSIEKAIMRHKNVRHIVNFASFRSAYTSTNELLDVQQVQTISIIAEGIPEQYARKLLLKARLLRKCILGPSTVGGIKPGYFRIGNTGGSIENIEQCRLQKFGGSVAFVTRSGGLLNELCNIVSQKCDGVYQGMSIGGDRYPSSNFIDFVLQYERDPNVRMIILLGEIGGVQEIYVANAVRNGLITKPIIGWCMGTSANYFSDDVQFGHAGASAHDELEGASFKNYYMKKCGIKVPSSFELLSSVIEKSFQKTVENQRESGEVGVSGELNSSRTIPKNRTKKTMFASISNELGEELEYNGVKISELASSNVASGIGKSLGHLWLKEDVPEWMARYFELILIITADHGAMVSGAHNTIVASRAGKDLVTTT